MPAEEQVTEPDPADREADATATALGPANRHRRIRRKPVAGGEVEYMPGAWTQTWSVTWHAKTSGWTVFDQRSSEDGAGEIESTFDSIEEAVSFVAGEISEHGAAMWGLWVREPDPTDHVELRRFAGRLRARVEPSASD